LIVHIKVQEEVHDRKAYEYPSGKRFVAECYSGFKTIAKKQGTKAFCRKNGEKITAINL
jgi:hypothetical protein